MDAKPLPNDLLRDINPFAELGSDRAGPRPGRLTVCCHNTRLGELHPELVARNCFGDPLIYSLNSSRCGGPRLRRRVVPRPRGTALS